MTITQFTMEEVRCFAGRQAFEIRPLTFLVGENSTGKTTALACFQVLADYLKNGNLDFNSNPYSMGTFKDIVRRSRSRERSFRLGFSLEDEKELIKYTVRFAQKAGSLEPAVSSTTLAFGDGELVFRAADASESVMKMGGYCDRSNKFCVDISSNILEHNKLSEILGVLAGPIPIDLEEGKKRLADFLGQWKSSKKSTANWDLLSGAVFSSISPVRSRPKRTYDPTREFNDPEGSDVPMRLMRIAETRPKEWERLKRQLVEFGNSSGLFQNIEVKTLGSSFGAPFQLKIKVRGPTVNIMDVGYGVSQVLPILEQILNEPSARHRGAGHSCYLLQQPEVHLHPRAQAELSSLLGQLASRGNQSFIIETHSDYLIDRARIDIMQGNINKDDVSLIYFEPKKNVVNVHNISFDEMGNMIGVPPHFREFFLLESDRLMGFAD